MINYIMLGTNNLETAIEFFDALLVGAGDSRTYKTDSMAAWSFGEGTTMLSVTKPFNEEPATVGNGVMVALKREFGQTPSHFRAEPAWPSWHARFEFHIPRGLKTMDVSIVEFPETKVALIEHQGAPERVYETAAKFIAWRKETGLSPVKTSRTYGVPYSDPKRTEPEAFRFDICGSVAEAVPPNDQDVKSGVIPGGRW